MVAAQALRDHLIAQLHGGQAYDTFDDIVDEFSSEQRGVVPDKAEHSAWQILEHLRISLRDILDYCRNEEGKYAEKNWPEDYWPKEAEPPTPASWEDAMKAYHSDLSDFEDLVRTQDLVAPFAWSEQGHTLLREALLVSDHAAYHLGQLVLLKRLL